MNKRQTIPHITDEPPPFLPSCPHCGRPYSYLGKCQRTGRFRFVCGCSGVRLYFASEPRSLANAPQKTLEAQS